MGALLEPDVVPDPDSVGTLHAFAASRERCGIAGPRTTWPDGSRSNRRGAASRPSRHSRPTHAASPDFSHRSSGSADHYLLDEDVEAPVGPDWLLGAFLLMRRAMLEELGGWDDRYRHYVEDIDLCYRAMRAGWAVVRAGSARHARLGADNRAAGSSPAEPGTPAA